MGVQTLMIVGMEMVLHLHQTPHCPEEEGIEGPDMFMYCKGLQGHQARKDNLDTWTPGQAGRDGRDGQALPLTRALEEALQSQRTNLDTTGLENSFGQFGRTMYEVLKSQQRTNQKLEEQFKWANEMQDFQREAMQDMAKANFQMKFIHMFASMPIYDGTYPDSFDDWLYQIESLCEMSNRDIRIELIGWASAQVKHIMSCRYRVGSSM